jgi:hypothetical protein
MSDLLIRNIAPHLKRKIEDAAKRNGQNLSEAAKTLIAKGLNAPVAGGGLGTKMFNMIRPEDRGDDLVFEYHGEMPKAPDFE